MYYFNGLIRNNRNIKYVTTHHEQAAALAAEGYSRMHNKLGCCIVTSGPGGTNAITGVLCSWLDSIPMIVISGQVNKEMTTDYTKLNLRQLGDQEFDIITSVKNMTKYAVQVNDSDTIKYHLEKACLEATTGRPGPVWIDIPLNVQSAEIQPDELAGWNEQPIVHKATKLQIDEIIQQWKKAKRPLIIVGNGVRLGGAVEELRVLLNKTISQQYQQLMVMM